MDTEETPVFQAGFIFTSVMPHPETYPLTHEVLWTRTRIGLIRCMEVLNHYCLGEARHSRSSSSLTGCSF